MKPTIPFLFLLLGFVILLMNCKDRSVTPPEPTTPEITGIELSSEQIIVNDSVLITIKLSEELEEEYALKWTLSGYQTQIDSVTSEPVFSWKAPKVHGTYEHSVQVVSTTGEPISDSYLFNTEIASFPVVPVDGNKLVFSMPAEDGSNQIFSMNLDGSELTQLTFLAPNSSYEPSWSPDGKHIVFTSSFKSTSNGPTIYLMNADGTNLRVMKSLPNSTTAYAGSGPKWSPDGTMIIFSAATIFKEIMVYNFEMDSVVRIAENTFQDSAPTWNPESNQIVFQSRRDVNPEDSTRLGNDLYVMDEDGGNVQRITETGSSRTPVWHPVDNTVAYSESSDSKFKLMTVDVTTKMTMKIQESFEDELIFWPVAWSSDGKSLLVQVRDYPLSTFHILDLETEEVTEIPLNPQEFSGIDWYQYEKE